MLHNSYGRALLFLLSLIFLSTATTRSANAPVLFYEDLQSGPNSGGESVSGFSGAYVTLYGNFFGTTQGTSTVTLGGSSCLRVVSWGSPYLWYQKIVVQLGSSCPSGSFVVSVAGQTSNALSFTVRPGKIYFVSPSGSNTNNGSISTPWQTLNKAMTTIAGGDVVYARNGVVTAGVDNYGAVLATHTANGAAGSPIAFVNYPGETPTILGTGTGVKRCITAGLSYWTWAGFTWSLLTGSECIYLLDGDHDRFIANDISCPNGSGSTGCVTTASNGVPFVEFLGNKIHDTGCPGSMTASYSVCADTQKTYHAFYWGDFNGALNHDITWAYGTVYNVYGCRAIMFHSRDSMAGSEAFNLSVHDNLIHNVRCDGILFANSNPDKGPISAYNNVLYHVGTGPDPSGQGANYSCIYAGDSNGNPVTPAQVYNNTCYDGGSRGASEGDAGAYTVNIPMHLTNNLTYQLPGEAYFTVATINANSSMISGSNNLWFGLSTAPSQTTSNIVVDPLLMNPSAFDFHLQAASPAIDAGLASNLAFDFDGVIRPQGAGIDIGAFEYSTGLTSSRPNPPTNLQITVN